ncbi:MAG: lipoyl(octanoyl) transferase LipB [Mucilaginibacter polytrichastri]|nr:lipoyl(octanoyl) transferase LipB [Mucilaginibacter polytrichastri]
MRNRQAEVHNWGLVDYREAWDRQEAIFSEMVAEKTARRTQVLAGDDDAQKTGVKTTPHHLIFCEHPHVYTLGKSGKPEHLLLDEAGLERVGARYYPINRGGDITYHGPGQLVCYPILDLDEFFTDIHLYLRTLEEAVILTMADFGLKGERSAGFTGVWMEPGTPNARKICAMGVRCSRWVTMHGLALNVNADLRYFKNIVPCGLEITNVTSFEAELGRPADFQLVQKILQQHISVLFGMELL